MKMYLNIAQLIISAALIAIILLQVRSSGLGSIFGGTDSAVYRKRRGVELTIFRITIGLSIAFFVVILVNVVAIG